MKKKILAITVLAVVGSQMQPAQARDRGWGVAAGVLGGLAVGTAIGASVSQPAYYSAPPTYYAPPPTYYSPPPVYYQPAPPPVAYYQPAPAYYYYPRPVVYAPAVTFGFGFGRPGFYGGYRHYRGRW